MNNVFIWLIAVIITAFTSDCSGGAAQIASSSFEDSAIELNCDADHVLQADVNVDLLAVTSPNYHFAALIEPPDSGGEVKSESGFVGFVESNWAALVLGLMGFIELIVRLTPTTKDDAAFMWIRNLFDFLIPNLKKGGGTHTAG